MSNDKTLPQYKCHKLVNAAKIQSITNSAEVGLDVTLQLPNGTTHVVHESAEWLARQKSAHRGKPLEGTYYIKYRDGFTSTSPASEFEDGYALVEEHVL